MIDLRRDYDSTTHRECKRTFVHVCVCNTTIVSLIRPSKVQSRVAKVVLKRVVSAQRTEKP